MVVGGSTVGAVVVVFGAAVDSICLGIFTATTLASESINNTIQTCNSNCEKTELFLYYKLVFSNLFECDLLGMFCFDFILVTMVLWNV